MPKSTAGVTLGSTLVSTDRVGLVSREFTEVGANTERIRVEPGRQYKIRWHVTSDTNANTNPQFRMRARALKFMWSQKLEIGGALAAGNSNNAIAQQALPGVGSQNPDQQTPGENGGWYTLLMHTPMSADIQLSQPYMVLSPPGDSSTSMRDIKFGFDLIDTLSGTAASREEMGEFTLDRVEVRSYDACLTDNRGGKGTAGTEGTAGTATTHTWCRREAGRPSGSLYDSSANRAVT